MKTINKVCQILAIVFALGSLVLFFFDFATITTAGKELSFVGAQLSFGGGEHGLAKSADILFCFCLTAISLLITGFSFKSKKLRYAAPVVGLIAAIYMLVIALSNPAEFVDKRPLPNVTAISYSPFVLITAIALFVFVAFAIAYLLIDDYLEVVASKGSKLTITKRVIRAIRDYRSEGKKIVWPGYKDVLKNTGIVIIMCILIGAFIWLVDYGLGWLLKLVLGA
jgi:preprotein translocase subunit SecE